MSTPEPVRMMMTKRTAIAVAFSLLGINGVSAGANQQPGLDILHSSRLISVGLADFDLLRARWKELKGTFVFRDGGEEQIASYELDYTLPVARSQVVFKKEAGTQYASVVVKLTSGAETVLDKSVALPPVVEAAHISPTKGRAAASQGFWRSPVPEALRALALPDYAAAPDAVLRKADRTVDVATTYKQVRCELNYPVTGANNNSLIQRQTDNPDDLSKHSMYISLRSAVYDPETGKHVREAKYLSELMLAKDWLMPALQTEGAVNVAIPVEFLRIHATEETVQSPQLGAVRVTGDDPGGLMQMYNSVAVDEEGNLYFSVPYRGVIRLNIHTRKWETPPVDLWSGSGSLHDQYHPSMAALLPKFEDVPKLDERLLCRRLDTLGHPYYLNGRIYLSLPRNAIFKNGTSLFLAAVVSIPTDHWDDADAFLRETKLNAGSWPTAKHALWDTWVQPNEMTRKLLRMQADPNGTRLYMLSYHSNYFWTLDIDEQGNTTRLTRLERFEGKPIVEFALDNDLRILTDRQGNSLGLTIAIRLERDKEKRIVFLPVDGYAFAGTIPANAVRQNWDYVRSRTYRRVRGERQYGLTTFSKVWLADRIGWGRKGVKAGEVTICYDALAAMRADKEHYGDLLSNIARYSLAPIYHIAPIPGDPTRVIGVSEYISYYQAFYDTTHADEGYVTKTYLRQKVDGVATTLGACLSMGPYAHLWRREGNRLYIYYVGYHKGLCRMLYSVDGEPLKEFTVEHLEQRLKPKAMDAGKPSKIMRFRHLNPGLGAKLLFTGTDSANRGGNAYSGGLLYFDTRVLDARYKLSEMSRCHDTDEMAWRVVHEPTGRSRQEVYLAGNFNAQYEPLLAPKLVPKTKTPKLFAYEVLPAPGGEGVRDLFAIGLVPAESAGSARFRSIAFARNQLYLLAFITLDEATYLASIDLTSGAFADVTRITNKILVFTKPNTNFITTPDGRVMIYVWDAPDARSATFSEVIAGPAGTLSFRPHLTLSAKEARDVSAGVPMGFVPDPRGDGSYDLMLGARRDRPDTRLRLIKDFVALRSQAALGRP